MQTSYRSMNCIPKLGLQPPRGQFFLGQKFFGTRNFFYQKFVWLQNVCLTQNCFDRKLFLAQKIFWAKFCFDQNIFLLTVFQHNDFFGAKILQTQNFLDPKFFSIIFDPKLFLTQNYSEPKIFWTQNFLDPKFSGPKIFRDPNFFRPKIFLDPKFFGPKSFLDPKFQLNKEFDSSAAQFVSYLHVFKKSYLATQTL